MSSFNQKGADAFFEYLMSAELDPPAQDMLARVCCMEGGFKVMAFLYAYPNTLSTVDGIAFRVHLAPALVKQTLMELFEMGLCQQVNSDPAFWGLIADTTKKSTIEQLIAWHDRWQARAHWLENI